jgi:hypothetical protein
MEYTVKEKKDNVCLLWMFGTCGRVEMHQFGTIKMRGLQKLLIEGTAPKLGLSICKKYSEGTWYWQNGGMHVKLRSSPRHCNKPIGIDWVGNYLPIVLYSVMSMLHFFFLSGWLEDDEYENVEDEERIEDDDF